MKIIGLMLARNEEWVLGLSLRAALLYCDAIVFTDHNSVDRTPEIVKEAEAEMGKPVSYLRHDNHNWDEMTVRHEQLVRGRAMGGTHFVIVDADELLTFNVVEQARQIVEACPVANCLALPMVSPYWELYRRRVDGAYGKGSRLSWCFTDDGNLSWAADFGYHHHMRVPRGCPQRANFYPPCAHHPVEGPIDLNWGGVFHLQYASEARLKAKAVWYKVMETIRWPGRMSAQQLNKKYDWTLDEIHADMSVPEFQVMPDSWWRGYIDLGWHKHLNANAEPWQAADARRMYHEEMTRAPSAFDGLKMHGVIP